VKNNTWRRLSDLLLCLGVLILLVVALLWLRSTFTSRQLFDWRYLIANSSVGLPKPAFPPTLTPKPIAVIIPTNIPQVTEEPAVIISQSTSEIEVQPTPYVPPDSETPLDPDQLQLESPPTQGISVSGPMALALPIVMRSEPPTPTPRPDTGRVVRLIIPRIKVDRTVVMVGLTRDSQGILQWDTDRLFATQNRSDLIGQLNNSMNPGQGGNVVLVGHNFDQGIFIWEGVFINLKSLNPGDHFIAYTEGGGQYEYIVQLVKKVPWKSHNKNEMEKHMKFVGPSESEQLTLMTCSGANIWPWPARLYVVAVPFELAAQ